MQLFSSHAVQDNMGAQQSTPQPQAAQPPPGCPMHQAELAPAPPPGCPMHNSDQDSAANSVQHAPMGQVNAWNNMPTLAQAPSQGQKGFLPLERTISSIPRAPSAAGPSAPMACPVAHGSPEAAATSGDNTGKAAETAKTNQWEYPSPQQFYNALVRKGWETPEESVEMMVDIHNWINEEAWHQVRQWEEKHPG